MNIDNSYALALTGSSPKPSRKASAIANSPARTDLGDSEWPAIGVDPSTVVHSSRTQGKVKQRKLNAFFELTKADKLARSPTKSTKSDDECTALRPSDILPEPPQAANGILGLGRESMELETLGTVRSKRKGQEKFSLTPKTLSDSNPKVGGSTTTDKSPPSAKPPATSGVETMGMPADPRTRWSAGKSDPPSETLMEAQDMADEEIEGILSSIKVKPKSKSASKTTSTKQRSTRSAVNFASPDPENVIVEPETVVTAVKIKHPFRTVLTATVRVDKVKDTLTNFIEKLTETLTFLRTHVDSTIAILPKDLESDYDHLIDKPSFPSVVFLLNQRYFNIDTRNAFSDATKTQNGRTVKLSLILGSTVEISHQLLDEVRYDTSNLGVTFWYKPHQEVDTMTRLVFLGAPNNANKEEAKTIIDNVLQPLERHLVTTDPATYSPDVFGLPWPNFAVVSEQPANLPTAKPEFGKDGKMIPRPYVPPPSERRSLHIMCKKSDYRRLLSLVLVAKTKKLWLKEFGMCYPVEAPDSSYTTTQCNDYLKMVDVHESAQMSYGTFRISGLKDP